MKFARTPLATLYDRVYNDRNMAALERLVVKLSAAGFLAHLAGIALARTFENPPPVIAAFGTSFLSAILTPFSVILFYEVLTLIASIPKSTTDALGTQFQIVSLIFIRHFFLDIGSLDRKSLEFQDLVPAFVSAGAGLLMFLLVSIFHRMTRHNRRPMTLATAAYVERKKAIAIVLTVILVSMAAYDLSLFARDAVTISKDEPGISREKRAYYADVFTVMIFTDVLILILSLDVSDRYELVFRNAAFVISTMLIRQSLTMEYPFAAAIGLIGMLFGIVTLAIYNYRGRAATVAS